MTIALGLTLSGCVLGDGGPGVADDDDGPGSNPGPVPVTPTPKLDVAVDKTTMSTELLTTNMVTVTLTAAGGFAGQVTLAGRAVDSVGATLPGWNVSLDKSTVDIAADGSATAVVTLKVPSQTGALAGTLKIDATSSLGAVAAISAVSVTQQISLTMTAPGATCAASDYKALTISQGTKIRWVNGQVGKRITIHVDPPDNEGINGFDHQDDPGMAANGGTYEQTAAGTGQITWYCHAPGNDANRYTITAVP
jgi:plastocyanin